MLLASNKISIESLWQHTWLGPMLQVSDLAQLAWKSVSTSSQVRLTVLIQTTRINHRLIHTYSETWTKTAATSSCRFKKVLYLKVYNELRFPYSSTRNTFSNWNKPNKITFSPFPLKLDHSAPKWIKMLLIGKENNSSLGRNCAVCVKLLSHVWLSLHPMDCSPPGSSIHRQEYWNRLPCPHPEHLPNPRIKSRSPALQADSLLSKSPGRALPEFIFIFSRRPNLMLFLGYTQYGLMEWIPTCTLKRLTTHAFSVSFIKC